MRKRLEEAIELFDGNDTRSFDEIYKGREDLFEGAIDDIISPKMRKLFEATYQTGNIQQTKLKEYGYSSVRELTDEDMGYGTEEPSETIKQHIVSDFMNGQIDSDEAMNQLMSEGYDHGEASSILEDACGCDPSEYVNDDGLFESFESIYNAANRIKEDVPGGHWDSGKGSPKPSGDGVPDAHNKAGMAGSDPATNQSTPAHSTNAKLGHEPAAGNSHNIHEEFEAIYRKARMK